MVLLGVPYRGRACECWWGPELCWSGQYAVPATRADKGLTQGTLGKGTLQSTRADKGLTHGTLRKGHCNPP